MSPIVKVLPFTAHQNLRSPDPNAGFAVVASKDDDLPCRTTACRLGSGFRNAQLSGLARPFVDPQQAFASPQSIPSVQHFELLVQQALFSALSISGPFRSNRAGLCFAAALLFLCNKRAWLSNSLERSLGVPGLAARKPRPINDAVINFVNMINTLNRHRRLVWGYRQNQRSL